jgi:hypothetical protein
MIRSLIRIAALMIFLSQAILLALALDFSGRTAILFSFVGHPMVVVGLGLTGYIILSRRSE